MRGALLFALAALGAAGSGCSPRRFCTNCFIDSGPPDDDAGNGQDDDGSQDGRTGIDGCAGALEMCNGRDDNCNGLIDEAPLADTGTVCGSAIGACRMGVTECADGKLVCGGGAVAPVGEICNGIDDDCDGMTDEGDPGGGANCGADTGECVHGTMTCEGGVLVCKGGVVPATEVCDGLDNNCDGTIDEGNPGGGAVCGGGPGSCVPGVLTCEGGALICKGATGPVREVCDGKDNDCDGMTDEDFDLSSDPEHCGDCATACAVAGGQPKCVAGACAVDFCYTDHWDVDGLYADGCEYDCSYGGTEICNGADDDCDGMTDEGLTPPAVCVTTGECAGTVATCKGGAGWRCLYGATVSQDASGAIVPESDCDGKDNDCDGVPDDFFPTKGKPCTRGQGVCTTNGNLVCNAAHDGLTCDAATPPAGGTETCNGKDDDCNGLVDDGAPDEWVTITGAFGSKKIYAYEASRPDATDTAQGAMNHRACSGANRLPWTNVTHGEADAACTAAGGRLCSEEEWQRACETAAAVACQWSYGGGDCLNYAPALCNGKDYDFDAVKPGDQDGLLATGALAMCFADWSAAGKIYDLSGNVKEWTAARSTGVNPLRGGAYNNTPVGTSCGWSYTIADDMFFFPNVGFRCCKD